MWSCRRFLFCPRFVRAARVLHGMDSTAPRDAEVPWFHRTSRLKARRSEEFRFTRPRKTGTTNSASGVESVGCTLIDGMARRQGASGGKLIFWTENE